MVRANQALGAKHSCKKCPTRFYDFGRADPHCPKCGGPPKVRKLRVSTAPAKPTLVVHRAEPEVDDDGLSDVDFDALAGEIDDLDDLDDDVDDDDDLDDGDDLSD